MLASKRNLEKNLKEKEIDNSQNESEKLYEEDIIDGILFLSATCLENFDAHKKPVVILKGDEKNVKNSPSSIPKSNVKGRNLRSNSSLNPPPPKKYPDSDEEDSSFSSSSTSTSSTSSTSSYKGSSSDLDSSSNSDSDSDFDSSSDSSPSSSPILGTKRKHEKRSNTRQKKPAPSKKIKPSISKSSTTTEARLKKPNKKLDRQLKFTPSKFENLVKVTPPVRSTRPPQIEKKMNNDLNKNTPLSNGNKLELNNKSTNQPKTSKLEKLQDLIRKEEEEGYSYQKGPIDEAVITEKYNRISKEMNASTLGNESDIDEELENGDHLEKMSSSKGFTKFRFKESTNKRKPKKGKTQRLGSFILHSNELTKEQKKDEENRKKRQDLQIGRRDQVVEEDGDEDGNQSKEKKGQGEKQQLQNINEKEKVVKEKELSTEKEKTKKKIKKKDKMIEKGNDNEKEKSGSEKEGELEREGIIKKKSRKERRDSINEEEVVNRDYDHYDNYDEYNNYSDEEIQDGDDQNQNPFEKVQQDAKNFESLKKISPSSKSEKRRNSNENEKRDTVKKSKLESFESLLLAVSAEQSHLQSPPPPPPSLTITKPLNENSPLKPKPLDFLEPKEPRDNKDLPLNSHLALGLSSVKEISFRDLPQIPPIFSSPNTTLNSSTSSIFMPSNGDERKLYSNSSKELKKNPKPKNSPPSPQLQTLPSISSIQNNLQNSRKEVFFFFFFFFQSKQKK